MRTELLTSYDLDVLGPLLLIGVAGMVLCLVAKTHRSFVAYASVLATVVLVTSYWVNPAMNTARSGAAFVDTVERHADPNAELGFVGFREQYLLNAHRPIVHFGHARWREAAQEAADAALWLSQSATRQLVVNELIRDLCFADSRTTPLGEANRSRWYIVSGKANGGCVDQGNAGAVYHYSPPLSAQ